MSTIIVHMIGSVTYLVGIVLLSNTVSQIYVNEILHQNGVTTKGRIIAKNKHTFCESTTLQRHYIVTEFVVHSAVSLVCTIKLSISQKLYNNYVSDDFVEIVYAKKDNKFYHNIKVRMEHELKAMTIYSNMALSMAIISIYPFIYFLSGHYTLIIFTIVVILCVVSTPHHHYHYDYQTKGHCINRMADRKDLLLFGFESQTVETTDIEHDDIDTSSTEFTIPSDSHDQITSNIPDQPDQRGHEIQDNLKCLTEETDHDKVSYDEKMMESPPATIAILYESYMEEPAAEESMDDEELDFVMVFN